MNIQDLQINNNQRMSSREIAELCDKRHDHVKRDIEVMLTQIELDIPKFGRIYSDSMNRQQTEYLLDKDLTITLVAGYNAKMRYLIIQRWQALEANTNTPAIPQTLSQALRLAADQADVIQQQHARLALVEPKAAALDLIDGAIGSQCVRDTAKTLCIPQNKFVAWCLSHDWMYRDNRNKLQMDSRRMKQGYMEQRNVTYFDSKGDHKATTQPLFTPKGLTHLARIFAIVHEVA